MENLRRFIGVRHRVKKTKAGEARPTQLHIRLPGGKTERYDLEDETAELDWIRGTFPTRFRDVTPEEKLDAFKPHQVKWRKLGKGEAHAAFPQNLTRSQGKTWFVATKVPDAFDGVTAGDVYGLPLGGSGQRFAFALSRRAEVVGAGVFWIPTFRLKEHRKAGVDKEQDAATLAELVEHARHLFYPVEARERQTIRVREALRARIDAMKSRIGCEQRLRDQVIGRIFLTEEDLYPEGTVEDIYDQRKASDTILANLLAEEEGREREVIAVLRTVPIWSQLFEKIEGIGPMIAVRLIAAIGDIRRFPTDAKLKAYCGVHVLPDGRFPRKRSGTVANWESDARQALYLFVDQCNRRPNSRWGKKVIECKEHLRKTHPTAITVQGMDEHGRPRFEKDGQPIMITKWSDGHVHKTALWKTATFFVRWLWREWRRIERQTAAVPVEV